MHEVEGRENGGLRANYKWRDSVVNQHGTSGRNSNLTRAPYDIRVYSLYEDVLAHNIMNLIMPHVTLPVHCLLPGFCQVHE
jgi:sulfur transfer complex TusBCD TusB component (DsrH family)